METKKKGVAGLQFLLRISLSILILTFTHCYSDRSGMKKKEVDDSGQNIHKVVNIVELECIETACFIPVDSGIAKSLIPIERNLYIEEGKAQILFIAQNCRRATWDENDISPMRKAHIWIRLDGQDTVKPVDGAERTLPTYFWWDHSGFTTSRALKEYMNATAWNMESVDSIEFNLKDHGRIVDQRNGKSQIMLEWFTTPNNSAEPLGINHKVFGRNRNGSLTADISGIIWPVSSMGDTRFVVNEGSPLSVFGEVLFGKSVDLDMTFQAVCHTSSR